MQSLVLLRGVCQNKRIHFRQASYRSGPLEKQLTTTTIDRTSSFDCFVIPTGCLALPQLLDGSIRANRFADSHEPSDSRKSPEGSRYEPLSCESRLGARQIANCRLEAIRTNRTNLMKIGFHLAAKGVRQKESGKKVTKKMTEASEKVTEKWPKAPRKRKKVIELLLPHSFCGTPRVSLRIDSRKSPRYALRIAGPSKLQLFCLV